MKTKSIFWVLVVLLMSMAACTKESLQGPTGVTGPQGNQGAKGEQGETGEGISNVRKFSFTIDKGTVGFANANFPDRSPWWGRQRGLGNSGAGCTIMPEQIGGLSLDDPNYLVLAYAKPEGTGAVYSQKKMMPFTYSLGTSENKIELLNNQSEILISKKATPGGGLTNPTFAEMPQYLHVDIYFIEIGNKTL